MEISTAAKATKTRLKLKQRRFRNMERKPGQFKNNNSVKTDYLDSVKKQPGYYKILGEKAMAQIPEEKLFWQYNNESNSIATIVKHLWRICFPGGRIF